MVDEKLATGFLTHLRHSQLLEWAELDRLVNEAERDRKTRTQEGLAAWLIARGAITEYQAERLLAGRPGDLVAGPYIIKEIVGTGDLGPIYRAVTRVGGKEFALRLIPRRNLAKAVKAKRHVRVFEKVNHAAVSRFADVGTSGAWHYLAWEYAPGESLHERVSANGPLEPGVAARYLAEAAEGVAACHEQGLTHGLLGPASLVIGGEGHIRVLDGGIAALLAESDGESMLKSLVASDQLVHGLDYASPESLMEPDKVTVASDIYSLGCSLYFCLTGRFPFEGAVLEKLQAHQFTQPTPVESVNPAVPAGLADVVWRMLQKNPVDRFASMHEVADALRPFVSELPRVTRPPVRAEKPAPSRASVAMATPEPTKALPLSAPPIKTQESDFAEEFDEPTPTGSGVRRNLGIVFVVLVVLLGVAMGWLLR